MYSEERPTFVCSVILFQTANSRKKLRLHGVLNIVESANLRIKTNFVRYFVSDRNDSLSLFCGVTISSNSVYHSDPELSCINVFIGLTSD